MQMQMQMQMPMQMQVQVQVQVQQVQRMASHMTIRLTREDVARLPQPSAGGQSVGCTLAPPRLL